MMKTPFVEWFKKNRLEVTGGLVVLLGAASMLSYLTLGGMNPVTRSLVLLALLSAFLLLFLANVSLEKLARSSRFRRGTASSVLVVAVLGILVLVNVAAARTGLRWDVTAEKMWSLSDQTRTVVSKLEKDITVTGFFAPEGVRGQVESLLQEYQSLSPRIKVRFVDPEQQPGLARDYGITSVPAIVVETEGQSRLLSGYSLFDFSAVQQTGDVNQVKFRGEQAVTRAIMELTHNIGAKLYLTSGHGEMRRFEQYEQLRLYIEGEGYKMEEWNIAVDGAFPEDCDIVVIAGPQRDFEEPEIQVLRDYMEGGGRLLLLADTVPQKNDQFVNLEAFAADLGIILHRDVVVDPKQAYYTDPLTPVPYLEWHDLTEKLIEADLPVALPRARSLAFDPENEAGYVGEALLRTSHEAWGETGSKVARDDADVAAPLYLAYTVSAPAQEGEEAETEGGETPGEEPQDIPAAVVIGDSQFVSNEVLGFQGNRDFMVNCLQWLMGRKELITIRPKEPVPRYLFLGPREANAIFYGTTLLLPFLVLVAGAAIWLGRRRS